MISRWFSRVKFAQTVRLIRRFSRRWLHTVYTENIIPMCKRRKSISLFKQLLNRLRSLSRAADRPRWMEFTGNSPINSENIGLTDHYSQQIYSTKNSHKIATLVQHCSREPGIRLRKKLLFTVVNIAMFSISRRRPWHPRCTRFGFAGVANAGIAD